MPPFNSMIKSVARGLSKEELNPMLKEATQLLSQNKPGFFSKLEEAAPLLDFGKKPGAKMDIGQIKGFLRGKQVGETEIKSTLGSVEGKVSKDELMGEIATNKTKFEDVVLGEVSPQEYETARLGGMDFGEGLKKVYDKTLPEKFKEYGKEEVGKLHIKAEPKVDEYGRWTTNRLDVEVPFISVTKKTPSRYPMLSIPPAVLAIMKSLQSKEERNN